MKELSQNLIDLSQDLMRKDTHVLDLLVLQKSYSDQDGANQRPKRAGKPVSNIFGGNRFANPISYNNMIGIPNLMENFK